MVEFISIWLQLSCLTLILLSAISFLANDPWWKDDDDTKIGVAFLTVIWPIGLMIIFVGVVIVLMDRGDS